MASTAEGIIHQLSNHSLNHTVENLRVTLRAKEISLSALVDHSEEAENVGLKMRPTRCLSSET